MRPYWSRYIFFGLFVLALASCRQAKYVGENAYLLNENEVVFEVPGEEGLDTTSKHEYLSAESMKEIVRPMVNRKFRLWIYNRIDTTRHAHQVSKKKRKFAKKNEKRAAREDRKNKKRIDKARSKGKDSYKPKVINSKETRRGWRDFVRTKWGEGPVLLDTFRVRKSREQLEIYLRKRGFRYASVSDTIYYNEKKKKAKASFVVTPRDPYLIKAITFDSTYKNRPFMIMYDGMTGEEGAILKVGELLDEDVLDSERDRFAQYCRDHAYFGFNKKYINYEVDTLAGGNEAVVKIIIKPKKIPSPSDSTKLAVLPHKTYKVQDVKFRLHNPDTASFGKNWDDFVRRCNSYGLDAYDHETKGFPLLDTIHIHRKGTFIYNYKPFLNPYLLDNQNFLEITGPTEIKDSIIYFKEYYIERSYRTMNKLDVFSTITIDVNIDPETPVGDKVIVDYDLYPSKKQSFLIEPRTSNTNGILGLTGAITYTNKNLFGGAQRLETSFIGGMEAQPNIVRDTTTTTSVKFTDIVNTFEIGPTLSLTFPKLVPMGKRLQGKLSKRLYPSTTFKSSVNVQQRREFLRVRGSFLYNWNFKEGKTREWKISLIELNFVSLGQDEEFQKTLEDLNDPFLLNSYSDHLTTALGVNWHFNNLQSNRRIARQSKHIHDIDISFKSSGAALYAAKIGRNDTLANGQWTINGVPYTTFLRFDFNYTISQYISERQSMAYRVLVGVGDPYGNSPSLPYEYAFFAGGSNDIRAFQAKTMAPGSTQKYIDPELPLTQIGDMRLELNLEYRFKLAGALEGALFVDAGNIWLISKEVSPGAFRWNSFYRSLALGAGFGIRYDLDFLVVRLDAGIPIHNPYLPETERWITKQHKPIYLSQIDGVYEAGVWQWTNPHRLNISFGIGYPF